MDLHPSSQFSTGFTSECFFTQNPVYDASSEGMAFDSSFSKTRAEI